MKVRFFVVLAFIALVGRSDAQELKPFQPRSMIGGYCHAGSRKDDKAEGYGTSDNAPKRINAKTPGTKGLVALVALPTESVAFMEKYQGLQLLLINRTAGETAFVACDSRLSIICEARDQSGNWKPIESLPSSGCLNSYHSAYLSSGHYWVFPAPVYSGSFKTRLRYRLQGEQPIYSNEFNGSINPVQFKKPKAPR